jgi:hypothetical protein
MRRQVRTEFDELRSRVEHVESVVVEIGKLIPALRRLELLLPNIDQLGPRLAVIDELGVMVEPLKSLCAQVSVLESIGGIVNRFLTENHVVSESVRVDVETISALAAQVELFNRQLLEQLQKALES